LTRAPAEFALPSVTLAGSVFHFLACRADHEVAARL